MVGNFTRNPRNPLTFNLQASEWAAELSDHPDKAYVKYILQGINNGFRIGLTEDSTFAQLVIIST